MPYYAEISNIPLIVHHPAHAARAGERRRALTQTTDLMPTFLDLFGVPFPKQVQGRSLAPLLGRDQDVRRATIFGMFGGPIGATDGRYTYYLYPDNLYGPGLHEYTLMPMHLHTLFTPAEMQTSQLAEPFDFTKGMPLLKIDALKDARRIPMHDQKLFDPGVGTTLYDLAQDPRQERPFRDADLEARMRQAITDILLAHDAPPEFYTRYNLSAPDGSPKKAPGQEEENA
jgi:hypothetical protein